MKGSSFQLVAESLIVAPPLSPPLLILGNPHWVQVDGNLSHSLLEKGEEVLFAFEEAIGFMFGTRVLDKDGVSGAAVTGEIAAYLYSHGQTLSSLLEEIYLKYGRVVSSNSYCIRHSKEIIKELFDGLRKDGQVIIMRQ